MASPTWKVMVYFAGQNRLADDMVYSLKDMKSVGSDENLTLLAQYSAKWLWKKESSPTQLPTPLRFDFKTNKKWVVSDYVEPARTELPEDSYIKELQKFILWGIEHKHRETDRYMVVLSGDGGGPVATFLPSIMEPHKKLEPFQLHKVFREVYKQIGHKIDVVGLDSCLMSTAEIGYELRNYVDYLVSSQGNVDDIGWPYADLLGWLKQHPTTSPEDLAKQAVDVYTNYFVDYAMIAKSSGNLSALNLAVFDDLATAIKTFVTEATALLPDSPRSDRAEGAKRLFAQLLVRAHWVAQTYRDDQYADLYDFCDKLIEEIHLAPPAPAANEVDFSGVVHACTDIKNILSSHTDPAGFDRPRLVLKSCYVGAKYQYSQGLSIYFPWNKIRETYEAYLRPESPNEGNHGVSANVEHSLPRAAGWKTFLEKYIRATQRSPSAGFVPGGDEFNKLMRDPPEGKGERAECETAKNPTLAWAIAPCINSHENL